MRRRVKLITALIIFALALSGFSFNRGAVTLDAAEHLLYRQTEAEELFLLDASDLKKDYDRLPVALHGLVKAVSASDNSIELSGVSGDLEKTVKCTFDKDIPAGLDVDDAVFVLGTARVTGLSSQRFIITKAVGVVDGAAGAVSGNFFTASGDIVSASAMTDKSFGRDTISGARRVGLKVPAAWALVEEELDNVEGFLYRLNELSDTRRAQPEQLYIFYFDSEKELADLNDRGRTTKIEEAIIKNILPNESIGLGRFPKKREAYGKRADYYDTGYGGYNAEFVFLQDGDNGILCMLYIFRTSDHRRDILTLFPFIDIER